jgi:predicted RNA-binding Zn-ribbon protein involved in translation (DUF1610 family)
MDSIKVEINPKELFELSACPVCGELSGFRLIKVDTQADRWECVNCRGHILTPHREPPVRDQS